eukprot:GILI01038930.1.p1 GENE.GILI01038930.1~~GILI01038930.1.p1  ORF type:complete len:473 (-),score=91.09 GILI01038930.1:73-1458(-)
MPPRLDAVFAHKTRDVALKVVSKCGLYRICAVSTTNPLQQTIDRHNLHSLESPALDPLGTHISLTNLIASMLQGEERLECKFMANFDVSLVCESLALGECRAYLGNSRPGTMDNVLSVQRVLYNNTDPALSATVASFDDVLPEELYKPTFSIMGTGGDDAKAERFLKSAVEHARHRFNLNLTPHAFHYFRQSEGIPTAVLLTSSVEDDYSHLTTGAAGEGVPSEARKRVVHSTGVLVQPLAIDMEKENKTPLVIRKLQNLFNGIALCPAPPTVSAIAHTALGLRNSEEGLLVQDILSLVTGDYSGARAVAAAARQMNTEDVETVRLQYQPIRDRYGLQELGTEASPASVGGIAESGSTKQVAVAEEVLNQTAIALDPTSLTRTSLDFFCRCSIESISGSFVSLPEAERVDLVGKTAGCVYCGKEYALSPKHLGLEEGSTDAAATGEQEQLSVPKSADCLAI